MGAKQRPIEKTGPSVKAGFAPNQYRKKLFRRESASFSVRLEASDCAPGHEGATRR
ncbi:hypothetical protein AvCA_10370 [Azotobacter vinelandii CA]|uniref:Uncharacterized protein n=2 Tax=Azotobacter vinelandii TaxID=354 RepID=C1DNQ3_AZOVD|nr:hypothetical protein Avin_10370 [Azotobacter vinelandii DJ]AGK17118.1 hypothetical protein AvCA_10370 [Azotobacter vinelandii CA]AGK19680.1 hypothetical protein AvCA6_10370 [Azotobacter vinelandii CA6]